MKQKVKYITILILLLSLVLISVFYTLFFTSETNNGLVREFIITNGFMVRKADAIDDYMKLFEVLKQNNVDLKNVDKNKSIAIGVKEKQELFVHLINGAKCKYLGLKKPHKLASFTNYDAPMDQVLKLDNLLTPLLKEEIASKEAIIAFMAFGEQLCGYEDVIVNATGIRSKYAAVKMLCTMNPEKIDLEDNNYSQFKAEIQKEFQAVKDRSKKR